MDIYLSSSGWTAEIMVLRIMAGHTSPPTNLKLKTSERATNLPKVRYSALKRKSNDQSKTQLALIATVTAIFTSTLTITTRTTTTTNLSQHRQPQRPEQPLQHQSQPTIRPGQSLPQRPSNNYLWYHHLCPKVGQRH